MSNSTLVTYTKISPYKYVRKQKISKIILHHMAGKLTAKQCGNIFQYAEASAHYGIGYDLSVGQYVPEDYSAWSAASYTYDQMSVAIELSNDGGASTNWHVSDAVIAKAIDLITDICKRNGISKLNYTGDLSGNLIMHCWTASTACPGPYMKTKFAYIASEVNKLLNASTDTTTKTTNTTTKTTTTTKTADTSYKVKVSISDLYIRKGPGTNYGNNGFIQPGVYTIVQTKSGTGSTKGWGKLKSGAGWISLDFATKV